MWYLRFDHIGEDRINKLKKYELLGSSTLESFSIYGFYLQEKMAKPSIIGYEVRTTNILILIYSDVCSPVDELAVDDSLYLITHVSDFYGMDIYVRHKSKILKILKNSDIK